MEINRRQAPTLIYLSSTSVETVRPCANFKISSQSLLSLIHLKGRTEGFGANSDCLDLDLGSAVARNGNGMRDGVVDWSVDCDDDRYQGERAGKKMSRSQPYGGVL